MLRFITSLKVYLIGKRRETQVTYQDVVERRFGTIFSVTLLLDGSRYGFENGPGGYTLQP